MKSYIKQPVQFGFWLQDRETEVLTEARRALNELVLKHFPAPPIQVLYIAYDTKPFAQTLHQLGYNLAAFDVPDLEQDGFDALIQNVPDDSEFEVILLHDCLQIFSDLNLLFDSLKTRLSHTGRLILSNAVARNEKASQRYALPQAKQLEQNYLQQGFFAQFQSAFETGEAGSVTSLDTEQRESNDDLLGYEIWDLRSSAFPITAYQTGSEKLIVQQFNQVFQENRSMDHWLWKFSSNPFGGPYVSMAWDNEKLASHYSAYPLPITVQGQQDRTFHVGDTFTVPAYRGVGRGRTCLLSRVVRHFHKSFCDGQVDFFYGFNTGRIQKLGKSFLDYVPVAPVFEYRYGQNQLNRGKSGRMKRLLQGYRIKITDQSGDWADTLFSRAKSEYAILISRSREYLHWRYDQHPDFNYQYVLLQYWGTVIGWWVIRMAGEKIFLVDALCLKQHRQQAVRSILEVMSAYPSITEISGWFSDQPGWWKRQLLDCGFEKQRQFQQLDLCVTFFSQKYDQGFIADNLYFTMGDSDLY